ncbi:hypothetical protein [Streptomyces sp. 351MFTsu5.1]|uniref:hypothetical protein n=1 Tax=Streptomyces sp. 351MFTsu5.1 TaxID=1172180 RepID=UPI00131A0EC8|nr:hypothetical protein [Streptomyces sp. 351MFTsu5.1]
MNEEQQNQLLEKIDKRIAERLAEQSKQIDKRFDDVDKRLDRQDEDFAEISTHLNARIDGLEEKLDTKADKERVYASLDAIMNRLGHDEAERAAVTSQVDRHETMLQKVARRLGLN